MHPVSGAFLNTLDKHNTRARHETWQTYACFFVCSCAIVICVSRSVFRVNFVAGAALWECFTCRVFTRNTRIFRCHRCAYSTLYYSLQVIQSACKAHKEHSDTKTKRADLWQSISATDEVGSLKNASRTREHF